MSALADPPMVRTGLRWPAVLGVLAAIALLGGAVAWAQLTRIHGAVIASGAVVVVGKPKSVQHLDGGVVEEILAEDSQMVEAGDVLMRLDPTLLRANLDIYRTRLSEALARRDRLAAEQTGRDLTFAPPPEDLKPKELDTRRAGQKEIFDTRRAVQRGRKEQLSEKILQYRNQIDGVEGLIASKRAQMTFLEEELTSTRRLSERGLARASQVLGLERQKADLLGQVSEHQSELARIANSIRDTELQILQAENEFREQAVTEYTEASASVEELAQQILSTAKQLDRVEIRAPVSGAVHEMQIVTIGGVVPPGATILQIVPRNQGVEFETRVDPASIDQVFVGQDATLRLAALNQRTTPELTGTVRWMSPTSVIDEATGAPFFRVQVGVSQDELARLGDIALVPGMPVDAFLQTGERTVMSYLTRPLTDQLGRAFREE